MRTIGYTSLATGKVKHIRIGGGRRTPVAQQPATKRRREQTVIRAEREAAIQANPLAGLTAFEHMQRHRIRKRLAEAARARVEEQYDEPLTSPRHNDLDLTIRK